MEHAAQFEETTTGLLARAPAKINLSLLIAGKRPDGFHNIETIMAKINYYDEIHFEPGRQDGIELICRGDHWAPEGPENLVFQAACRLLAHVGQQPDLRLILTKNIPAGTGLGSASSDAATTLLGLNRYLDLGLAPDALHEMAASLGSDVAFFLHGPLAYCTGRGEIVTALPAPFAFVAILVLPNINVSTAKVYKNYLHDHQNYETLHRQISAHISKNRIDFLTTLCTNMLSSTCYELETNLASLKDRVEACGLGPVCLSGSGSALVCWIKGGIEKARECQCTIERATNCLTRIVTHNGW